MDSPGAWAIIWLVVAAAFGAGEIAMAGSFFLMPFAIGAAAAAIASLLSAPVALSWLIFLAVSIASFFALKPLAARLDAELPNPRGFGSNRLVGTEGIVEEAIPQGETGTGQVRIGGEQWRAVARGGLGLPVGTPVTVIAVEGTRVIVSPSLQAGLGPIT